MDDTAAGSNGPGPLAASEADGAPGSDLGVAVAEHYGDPVAEHAALQTGAGVADVSHRASVLVGGSDAATFLQSLVSADLATVGDGQGVHSLLLTPQGKLVVDHRALRVSAEEWWLDADVGTGPALVEGLGRFKIRVAVDLLDRSAEWGALLVRGPLAAARVGDALAVTPPAAPHAHVPGPRGLRVVGADWSRYPGVDVLGRRDAVAEAWAMLVEAGVARVGRQALERARVEAGVPRQGFDLDERTIPQAAGLERDAVSFTKGCFLGQELVCRIDSRGGQVPRRLRRLREVGAPAGDAVLVGGAEVRAGDDLVGEVTSAAPLGDGAGLALAYVRREVPPGAVVSVALPGSASPVACTVEVLEDAASGA